MAQVQIPGIGWFDEGTAGGESQIPGQAFVDEDQTSSTTTIIVPLGQLVLAAFAPTVVVSDNTVIIVPLGALRLTGLAPTIGVTTVTNDDFLAWLLRDG